MLSDFSTLTDLRDFESALDRELLTSVSSEIDFSLRVSGVRERSRRRDDLAETMTGSLLRLDRDLLPVAGGGEGELRLLLDRGEREECFSLRCDFLLRSRDRERLPLPLPPPPVPWERELREREVLRRWRDLERLPRDLEERECLPPRERDLLEREELRRCRDLERLLRERDECLPRDLERRDRDTLRRSLEPERLERRLDVERCERDRLVRRSRERDRDLDLRRLSLASIPITGSMAAEIILCASFTMVMASSISACAASFDFASGLVMEYVEW